MADSKLTALRKLLLGDQIFEVCKNDPLGIKEEDLKARLDHLKTQGFDGDCSLVELVKVCQLKLYRPKCKPEGYQDNERKLSKLLKIKKTDCVGPKYEWIVGKGCYERERHLIEDDHPSTVDGLHIGTKTFKRISGPVSMYVLLPSLAGALNLKLPIIVFFGDVHKDMTFENVCQNCEMPSCTYLHETTFIKELDGISTPQFPVEFSIEAFFTDVFNKKIDAVEQDHPMLRVLRGLLPATLWNYYSCFLHAKPDKRNTECAIGKNMRWQFADIRNFRLIFQTTDFKYWYEACLYTIFSAVAEPNTTLKTLQTIAQQIKKRCNESGIVLKPFMDHCKQMIADLIFEYPTFCENLVSSSDFYDISMLRKQIKKNGQNRKIRQHPYIIENLPKWVYEYGKYQEQVQLKSLHDLYDVYPDWNVKVKDKIDECFNIIKLLAYGYQINEKLEEKFRVMRQVEYNLFFIDAFLTTRLSILLDLYYVLRLFKIQDDIVHPVMSFNIFGNAHTENLVHFLTSITKLYDIQFEKRVQQNKCINIDKPVDLNYYINEWKGKNK